MGRTSSKYTWTIATARGSYPRRKLLMLFDVQDRIHCRQRFVTLPRNTKVQASPWHSFRRSSAYVRDRTNHREMSSQRVWLCSIGRGRIYASESAETPDHRHSVWGGDEARGIRAPDVHSEDKRGRFGEAGGHRALTGVTLTCGYRVLYWRDCNIFLGLVIKVCSSGY